MFEKNSGQNDFNYNFDLHFYMFQPANCLFLSKKNANQASSKCI